MNTLLILAAVMLFAMLAMPSHAVVNTGLLTKGLRSEFFEKLNAEPTYFQDLCTVVKSNADQEVQRWIGALPMMRAWGNGRLAQGLLTEGYTIVNETYESTIEADQNEVNDDQTGQIRMRILEMAEYAATHKDFLVAQLLMNGAAAGYHSYDGVPFFDTAHVSGDSGNQDNDLTMNIVDPTRPTTAEFRSALEAMISALMGFKNDKGHPRNLDSDGLVAVVPVNYWFVALEALSAAIISNTTNVIAGLAKVIKFPWLTVNDEFFLLKTNRTRRPFIFQDREPVSFVAIDSPDSEEVFNTGKYKFGTRARYKLAYGEWATAVRMKFT